MLSDADFSHRLDITLLQVSRDFQGSMFFRGPRAEEVFQGSTLECQDCSTSSLNLGFSFYAVGGGPRDAEKGSENPVAEKTLRQIAKAECELRVKMLQKWMDRVAQERRLGEQCLAVLKELSTCLSSMHDVTKAVQEQSDNLSINASALMVRKTKLEMVQEELVRVIRHFIRIDVLTREIEDTALTVTSSRFQNMLQEMNEELHFLSLNPQFLSTKPYADKLTEAKHRALRCLKDAVLDSLRSAQSATLYSETYCGLFNENQHISSTEGTLEICDGTGTCAPPQHRFNFDGSSEAGAIMTERLSCINSVFCERLEESASLRRLFEGRGSNGVLRDDVCVDEVLLLYCEVRVVIIGPLLQSWLEKCSCSTVSAELLPHIVSKIIFFMKLVLTCEKTVFDQVWFRDDYIARVFPHLITGFSNEVYHVFRSKLLQVDAIEELSRTIEEIQRANMRQDSVAELGDLMIKMTQDTQERLIFRTSVFLRQYIVRSPPTKKQLEEFMDTDKNTTDVFIPALSSCVELLRLLYPSLELSVFSVFAEEAIHCTLVQVQELAKLIGQQQGCEHSVIKGLLCQLRHLLHLRVELSCIHESIKVVEKVIDFSKITQRRLEIVQLSRESKKDVEGEIKKCCECIVQVVFSEVSAPLHGLALKKKDDVEAAVAAVEQRWATQRRLLDAFVLDAATRDALLCPVRARIDELLRETALIKVKVDH